MRLLLITDGFPPDFAPRMGNLCKNLANEGWEIDVYCEEKSYSECNMAMDTSKIKIQRIKYPLGNGKISYILQYLLNIIYPHKDTYLYNRIKNEVHAGNYECVLTSSYHIFPLHCARLTAQHLNIPLYVDLRDITEQYPTPQGFAGQLSLFLKGWKLHQKRRNKILKSAQGVSTISPWHVEYLKTFNPNTRLVFNGYDEQSFNFMAINTEKFRLIYTGRIIDFEQRNPEILFEALKKLKKNGMCKELVADWFVDKESKQLLLRALKKYDIEDINMCHEMRNLEEIPQLLQNSSIIIVLTNQASTNGPKGIMTTKFFEAIGVEKPVLCTPNDEGCLKQVIHQTNAGLAATNSEEIETFILEKYDEWKKNGHTHQAVIQSEKAKFTRQYQAQQFVEMMTKH